MGSTKEKLARVAQTKEEIRQAIISKKMDVPTTTKFRDYPAKIRGIYPDALFIEPHNFFKNTPIVYRSYKNSSGGTLYHGDGKYLIIMYNGQDSNRYSYLSGSENNGWVTTPKEFVGDTMHFTNATYFKGKFVCFGYLSDGTIRCYRSTTGASWKYSDVKNISGLGEIVSVTHDKEKFVAAGHNWSGTSYILTSTDAITWTLAWSGKSLNDVIGIAYFEGVDTFVACHSSKLSWSVGDTWAWTKSDLSGLGVPAVSGNMGGFQYSTFYVTDKVVAIRPNYSTGVAYMLYSTDGKVWKKTVIGDSGKLQCFCKLGSEYMMFCQEYTGIAPANTNKFLRVYKTVDDLLNENGKESRLSPHQWGELCYAGEKMISYSSSWDYNGTKNVTYSFALSYDGVSFMPDLTNKIVDVNGKDVSATTLQALRGIHVGALQAAYQAGVNSI